MSDDVASVHHFFMEKYLGVRNGLRPVCIWQIIPTSSPCFYLLVLNVFDDKLIISRHDLSFLGRHQADRKAIGQRLGRGRKIEGKRRDGKLFPMLVTISEVMLNESLIKSGAQRQFTAAMRDLSQLMSIAGELSTQRSVACTATLSDSHCSPFMRIMSHLCVPFLGKCVRKLLREMATIRCLMDTDGCCRFRNTALLGPTTTA